ncbi:carbohydrate ABC transporter permease [uncultured Aeromicrobium sp.]|uniref:carbohydrate ABC transporter permease n=1 Tax=uncultured Aeromicrobium sp. TaxID=337820 RepID=UPI0025D7564D|nr:sugar ABC transporter permease [uncultured Aeromicrobium sp.]
MTDTTARPRWRRRQAWSAWLFAFPFMTVFSLFMIGPLAASLAMSMSDITARDLRNPFAVSFVGLSNFAELLTDARFLRAIVNTVYFAGVGVPLTVVAALLIAVALNNGIGRLRAIFRMGFYTPVVTSIVAIGIVWRFILEPDGMLNRALATIGITGADWLNDTTWAMPWLIILAVWRNLGTLMIIFLAGLQGISEEVHEAARVDGAGPVQRFFRITLPLMRPSILLGCVLISVYYFQFFEEAFVMTGGGPLDSTLSITYFTYDHFGYGNYGYAAGVCCTNG